MVTRQTGYPRVRFRRPRFPAHIPKIGDCPQLDMGQGRGAASRLLPWTDGHMSALEFRRSLVQTKKFPPARSRRPYWYGIPSTVGVARSWSGNQYRKFPASPHGEGLYKTPIALRSIISLWGQRRSTGSRSLRKGRDEGVLVFGDSPVKVLS